MLRPNAKRSRSAIRDIQLIRWIGFARYGETDLERLVKLGASQRRIIGNFGSPMRSCCDCDTSCTFVRTRARTCSIGACKWRSLKRGAMKVPMRFCPLNSSCRISSSTRGMFVTRRRSSWMTRQTRPLIHRVVERVFSRKVDERIRMGPTHIWVPKEDLESFASSLPDVLRLMRLANQHRRRISHRTWQAIRNAMQDRDPTPPDKETIEEFLSLLIVRDAWRPCCSTAQIAGHRTIDS